MADETAKHTPESVAAKVVKALLNAPTGTKDGKKDHATKKRPQRSTIE